MNFLPYPQNHLLVPLFFCQNPTKQLSLSVTCMFIMLPRSKSLWVNMAQREMYLLFNSQLRISHKRKKLITYNQRVWIYNSTFVFSALMAVPLLDNQVFICKDLFQPQIWFWFPWTSLKGHFNYFSILNSHGDIPYCCCRWKHLSNNNC